MELMAWKKELDHLVMEVLAEQVKEEVVELEKEEKREQECSVSGEEKVMVRNEKSKKKYGMEGNTEDVVTKSDEDDDFKKTKATRMPSKVKKRNISKENEDNNTSKKTKLPSKGGFMAMLQLSPDLADIVGESQMQRHEVIKRCIDAS